MKRVSRCLVGRESAVTNSYGWINNNNNNYGIVKHMKQRTLCFPKPRFFCTSSDSISQIQQSNTIKYPFDWSFTKDYPGVDASAYTRFYHEDWCLDEKCVRDQNDWRFLHRGGNCLISHLIQIFSMTLHTNFNDYGDGDGDGDDKVCEVYGSVQPTNPQGFGSNLYTRSLTNPDTIPNKSILSLMEGRGNVITYGHASNTILDLDLNDRSRNTVIIKKKHNLHSITEEIEDSSNKLLKDIVHGEHGFVVVYYTKFLFAIYVAIEIAIFNKKEPGSPFLHVYGDIVAGYSNASEYCSSDDEVRHMKCTLFSKPVDNPQQAENGRPMKLSRFGMALPVYGSSLVIEANISDANGQLVRGSVQFPWPGHFKKVIDDKFGAIVVLVHDRRPIGELFSEAEDEYSEAEDEYSEAEDEVSTKEPLMELINSVSFINSISENSLVEEVEKRYAHELLEMFSVYVGNTKHEASSISGTVYVYDCSGSGKGWNVFERGIDNPVLFPERKNSFAGFVPLERHRQIETHSDFVIGLCLKDQISNKEVCEGQISFGRYLCKANLFNKPLYSVVVGVHGYVILHYILYYKAFKATVEITFVPDPSTSVPLSICGCIFASNSDHNYSSNYEKKFYRSLLFNRPEPEIVQLDRHSRVILSKSVVAIPKGSALVIEVDLRAMSGHNPQDVVFGKKEFKVSFSKTRRAEILGKHCCIQISANFE